MNGFKDFLVILFFTSYAEGYVKEGYYPTQQPTTETCIVRAKKITEYMAGQSFDDRYVVACVPATNSRNAVETLKQIVKQGGKMKPEFEL